MVSIIMYISWRTEWNRIEWHSDLLCILFKQAQLETLVQLQLPHVPELLQILASPMQFIQQTCHFSY